MRPTKSKDVARSTHPPSLNGRNLLRPRSPDAYSLRAAPTPPISSTSSKPRVIASVALNHSRPICIGLPSTSKAAIETARRTRPCGSSARASESNAQSSTWKLCCWTGAGIFSVTPCSASVRVVGVVGCAIPMVHSSWELGDVI